MSGRTLKAIKSSDLDMVWNEHVTQPTRISFGFSRSECLPANQLQASLRLQQDPPKHHPAFPADLATTFHNASTGACEDQEILLYP
jgi:hypothetical protein